MATDEDAKPTFADWTNRLKAYNDYIKALAEYQQAAGEAALNAAEAAAQWEKVRALRFALAQLARDFADLRRMTARYRQDAARLRERESHALILLRGRPTELWTQAWGGYLWFQTRALLESTEDLYAVLVPTMGREAANFVHQKGAQSPCVPLPVEISSALAMMTWLKEHRQLPRVGTPPHQAMSGLFRAINGVVAASIAHMQDAIVAMRKGTFEAWKPNLLLGITEPTKRSRIEWTPSPAFQNGPSGAARRPNPRPR